MSKCFITGADTNHEDLLPWWLYNVKKHNPNIDVMIWDFGLSLKMNEYLHKNNINVSPPLKHPINSWFYKPRGPSNQKNIESDMPDPHSGSPEAQKK